MHATLSTPIFVCGIPTEDIKPTATHKSHITKQRKYTPLVPNTRLHPEGKKTKSPMHKLNDVPEVPSHTDEGPSDQSVSS